MTPRNTDRDRLRPQLVTPLITAQMWLILGAVVVMTVLGPTPLAGLRVAALPLALLVPGYAILNTIFGRNLRQDPIVMVALSILLSLTVYTFLALMLYAVSIRITPDSVTAGTDCFVLALIGVFLLRRWNGEGPSGWPMPPIETPEPMLRRMPMKRLLSYSRGRNRLRLIQRSPGWAAGYVLGTALSILVLIVTLHYTPKPEDAAFTQFYLAGSSAHAGTILEVPIGTALMVSVGIANHTHEAQTYLLQPILDTGISWPLQEIRLQVGRTWSGVLDGPVTMDNCTHRLLLQLSTPLNHATVATLIVWVRGATKTESICAASHG